MQTAHTPALGGPTKVTFAEILFEYSHLYSIGEKGAARNIVRISRIDLREFSSAMKVKSRCSNTLSASPSMNGTGADSSTPARRLELPKPAPARQAELNNDEGALRLEALDWRSNWIGTRSFIERAGRRSRRVAWLQRWGETTACNGADETFVRQFGTPAIVMPAGAE